MQVVSREPWNIPTEVSLNGQFDIRRFQDAFKSPTASKEEIVQAACSMVPLLVMHKEIAKSAITYIASAQTFR